MARVPEYGFNLQGSAEPYNGPPPPPVVPKLIGFTDTGMYPTNAPPPYSSIADSNENNNSNVSTERPTSFTNNNFSDKNIRNNFIKKVYLILTAQLLVTSTLIAIFIFVVIFLVSYIAISCCGNIRRKYPLNIILLSILTLSMAYMAGTISAFHNIDAVLIATGMTVIICIFVTVLAIWGPIDFTKWHFYLAIAGFVFVLFGIVCLIVQLAMKQNKILQIVYASIGVLLFSLYLAYSTQQIVGGRRYQLSEEEYVTGALELYVDIVNIFLLLLGLTSAADS